MTAVIDPFELGPTQVRILDLLTAEEEVHLAHAIEAGLLAHERLDAGVDDLELRVDLKQLVRLGERAMERFLVCNLRLVAFWARRRWLAGGSGSLSLEELYGEGVLGLIHALEMFDFTLGFKFSTYSSNWIRNHICRAAGRSGATHVPEYVQVEIARVLRTVEDLTDKLHRQPTDAEVARELGITARRVAELRGYLRSAHSLDATFGQMEKTTLADVLADPTDLTDLICERQLQQHVGALLAALSTREQNVLTLRFGLAGQDPHTVEETAALLDVQPAMVRDCLTGALAKLRAHGDVEQLHAFLEAA